MREKIFDLIRDSFEEVNMTRSEKIPLDSLNELILYGEDGIFDSMQVVNLLTIVEEKIFDDMNVEVSLTSERAVSRKESPFRSVKNLIDFILEELDIAAAA
jgi:acyl carrier protein